MRKQDKLQIPLRDKDFFILLRSGLWELAEEPLSPNPDWDYIVKLSEEQAVFGLISEGFAILRKRYPEVSIPEAIESRLMSGTATIVRQNIELSRFQSQLLSLLENKGITALVIKGLGLAQNYPNPNVRQCGDIDFLLPAEDYHKAKELLAPMAQSISAEYKKNMHWGAVINGFEVELHGTVLSFFLDRADRMFLKMQDEMFASKDFITKSADKGLNFFNTPGYQMDILYTFFHILKHLAQGLGIRQICDLAVMLKAYSGKFDNDQFWTVIKEMKLSKYWQIMMSFCVCCIGMPDKYAVNYDCRYSRYNGILWDHINSIGNFGAAQKRILEDENKVMSIIRKTNEMLKFSGISKRLAMRRLVGMYGNLLASIPKRLERLKLR